MNDNKNKLSETMNSKLFHKSFKCMMLYLKELTKNQIYTKFNFFVYIFSNCNRISPYPSLIKR